MHKIKESILKKLMYAQQLSFNELWDKKGESNVFAYHLKILEEDGFVKKDGNKYSLTLEGKKYVLYVGGDSGKITKPPLSSVAIIVYNKETDEVLMQKRTKEPFFNIWTQPAGKLEHDQYILECAEKELLSETGLTCDLSLKGLISTKTFTEEGLAFNHNIFIVLGLNPKGTLLSSMNEGINKWVKRDEIKNLKTFLNMNYNLEIALGEGFRWVEFDGFMENNEFVKLVLKRDERFLK